MACKTSSVTETYKYGVWFLLFPMMPSRVRVTAYGAVEYYYSVRMGLVPYLAIPAVQVGGREVGGILDMTVALYIAANTGTAVSPNSVPDVAQI